MFGLQPWEILLILLIVLIVFGAGKLPDAAGSMGKAIREFRKGVQTEERATKGARDAEKGEGSQKQG